MKVTEKTCEHCGHTGPDVVLRNEWVGGKGYVPVIECQNRRACWKRIDKEKE